MSDACNWLVDIPFWEESQIGCESKQFSPDDFLTHGKRPGVRALSAHFRHWCRVRRFDALELYDARTLGMLHGVDILLGAR